MPRANLRLGRVTSDAYLWCAEHAQGREDVGKDRPYAVSVGARPRCHRPPATGDAADTRVFDRLSGEA
jgi:hypothetical protein